MISENSKIFRWDIQPQPRRIINAIEDSGARNRGVFYANVAVNRDHGIGGDARLDDVTLSTLEILYGYGLFNQRTKLAKLTENFTDGRGKLRIDSLILYNDRNYREVGIDPILRQQVRTAIGDFYRGVMFVDPACGGGRNGLSLLELNSEQEDRLKKSGLGFPEVLAFDDSAVVKHLNISSIRKVRSTYRPQVANAAWTYLNQAHERIVQEADARIKANGPTLVARQLQP